MSKNGFFNFYEIGPRSKHELKQFILKVKIEQKALKGKILAVTFEWEKKSG